MGHIILFCPCTYFSLLSAGNYQEADKAVKISSTDKTCLLITRMGLSVSNSNKSQILLLSFEKDQILTIKHQVQNIRKFSFMGGW